MLAPLIGQIRDSLATTLSVHPSLVNIKAKTTDGLGFLGRGEGIAALAIATVEQPT